MRNFAGLAWRGDKNDVVDEEVGEEWNWCLNECIALRAKIRNVLKRSKDEINEPTKFLTKDASNEC